MLKICGEYRCEIVEEFFRKNVGKRILIVLFLLVDMKHCILMTAYKDVGMINEFISLIPDQWGCYVHLDKKCKIDIGEIASKAKVFKQYRIYWGGVEHLKAFLLLLTKAYNDGCDYDYYHLVTGQDFFAVSPKQFDEIIGDKRLNYIEFHKCPYAVWDKCWGGGFDMLRYRTLASYCDVRKPIYYILNKTFHVLQKGLSCQRPLPPYPIYGGSVYCSLTSDAVKEILYSSLANDLLLRLKNSTCGEEVFFQTVLMNSQCKDHIINDKLRYMDWSVKEPPKVLRDEDYDKIVNSKVLFCRKTDSICSRNLLDRLLEDIRNNM